MLERQGRVDQTAVEEDPAVMAGHARTVLGSHFDRTTGEGGEVDPGQRAPVTSLLVFHDPATGFGYGGKPPALQFGEQGRLSATRTAGKH
jgi:hypothetical protein